MDEKPSTAKLALKWGGITGLVEILITTIRYAVGYYSGFSATIFMTANLAVIVTGLVLALREFRAINGGYMTLGEMVGLGALMFAIMGLLDSLYMQFYQNFIDPNYLAKTLQQTRDFMEQQGIPDDQPDKFDEQLSEAVEQQRQKGASGSAFLLGVIWWSVGGTVLSLIASLFMRRTKDNPFD